MTDAEAIRTILELVKRTDDRSLYVVDAVGKLTAESSSTRAKVDATHARLVDHCDEDKKFHEETQAELAQLHGNDRKFRRKLNSVGELAEITGSFHVETRKQWSKLARWAVRGALTVAFLGLNALVAYLAGKGGH